LNKVVYWISYRYHHYRLLEYQLKFIPYCHSVPPHHPTLFGRCPTLASYNLYNLSRYVVHSQHLHVPMLHSKGLNNVHFEGSVWWRGTAYSWHMIGLCGMVGQIQIYSVTARTGDAIFSGPKDPGPGTRGPGDPGTQGPRDPGTQTQIGIHCVCTCIYNTCVYNRLTGMHYGTD